MKNGAIQLHYFARCFTIAGIVMPTENDQALLYENHIIRNWADSGSNSQKAGFTYGTINI
jgi:hypothetical protein